MLLSAGFQIKVGTSSQAWLWSSHQSTSENLCPLVGLACLRGFGQTGTFREERCKDVKPHHTDWWRDWDYWAVECRLGQGRGGGQRLILKL